MQKANTEVLTAIVVRCFDLSMDDRIRVAQQDKFRAHGKRLRGDLVSIVSMQFEDGDTVLAAANAKMSEVNDELSEDAADLQNVADTLSNVAKLVSSVDKLLNVGVAFA